MYILTMPSRFISKKASLEEIEVYEFYKQQLKDLNEGKIAHIILPSDVNPETRQPLFQLIYVNN